MAVCIQFLENLWLIIWQLYVQPCTIVSNFERSDNFVNFSNFSIFSIFSNYATYSVMKFLMISFPLGVRTDSGWNCMP